MHTLLRSPGFIRAAKKMLRKKPEYADELHKVLRQLGKDPSTPSLRTHKLTGNLKGSWACSVGYDMRIVFSFTKQDGGEAILLETIGTHDEVY
jgi:addiction module RelE/StbE family toxin